MVTNSIGLLPTLLMPCGDLPRLAAYQSYRDHYQHSRWLSDFTDALPDLPRLTNPYWHATDIPNDLAMLLMCYRTYRGIPIHTNMLPMLPMHLRQHSQASDSYQQPSYRHPATSCTFGNAHYRWVRFRLTEGSQFFSLGWLLRLASLWVEKWCRGLHNTYLASIRQIW